jgi:hypothetical protein
MNNSKVKNFLLLVSINQINKFSFLNVHELSFLQSLEITITPSKKKKLFTFYNESFKLLNFLTLSHGSFQRLKKRNILNKKGLIKNKKNFFNIRIILRKKFLVNFIYQYLFFAVPYFNKKFVFIKNDFFYPSFFYFTLKDINCFPGVVDNFLFLETKLFLKFNFKNNTHSTFLSSYLLKELLQN